MKYKKFYFYIFISFCCFFILGLNSVLAFCGDFGVKIVPSLVYFSDVSTGDDLSQSIEFIRNCGSGIYDVDYKIDDSEIAEWIFLPAEDIRFEDGQLNTSVDLKIKVPQDIDLGIFNGSVLFTIFSKNSMEHNGVFVNVNIGVRPTIKIDVTKKNYIKVYNSDILNNLRGRIIIKTEDLGRAFYIHPTLNKMFSLGSPEEAFAVMRSQGVGISNGDLTKFIENGKTNENVFIVDDFLNEHAGKIFLQIEEHGEAWYVNPENKERYFLGRPSDAFKIMRELGLGINNHDFDLLVNK